MTSIAAIPPSVLWAQRRNSVLLKFDVECEKPEIKIERNALSFKGKSVHDGKNYELDIPLFAEINPEKSRQSNKGRYIELELVKENNLEPFWPYLTNDKHKYHWLKVDFDKWQDEDTSGEEVLSSDEEFDGEEEDDEEEGDSDDAVIKSDDVIKSES